MPRLQSDGGQRAQNDTTPRRRRHPKRGHHQPNTPTRPGRLAKAAKAVHQGMSIRVAAFTYGVKRSTLAEHKKRSKPKSVGRPTELTETEEKAVVDHLLVQAEWGFPLTRFEIRLAIQDYLNKYARDSNRFVSNLPGVKWLRGFLQRHAQLQARVPKLVSSARAKVDPTQVNKYFDNLEVTISGVPPENILNFDETSVSDNPDAKKIVVKRGEKYPVKVLTTSKSAVSVMFAGTAGGQVFPPYVVYKSKELSESWTTGGPVGARYNRSKSGWFDKDIFTEWFKTLVLPWARRTEGKKVVIGDNVSSHFSNEVFKWCGECNISFVCLPPNSTHLLQPLDVSFFGPLKTSWRKILSDWKSQGRNRNLTLPKPHFPKLLKKLVDAISDHSESNLRAAFKATGIHPLDRQQALKRIPGGVLSPAREEVYRRVSGTFVETLQGQQYGDRTTTKRGRTIRLSPGKSYAQPATDDTEQDFDGNEEAEEAVDTPDEASDVTVACQRNCTPRRESRQARRRLASPARQSAQPKRPKKSRACDRAANRTAVPQPEAAAPGTVAVIEPNVGDWVLVKIRAFYSVGCIQGVDENHDLICKLLKPGDKNLFLWPTDELKRAVDYSEVVEILTAPTKLKKRAALSDLISRLKASIYSRTSL